MIDDSQGNLSGFYTEPTIPVAGLRVSLEITCRQDEEGFASALEALHTVFQKLTTGFRTTRPPPPSSPPFAI